MDTKLKSTILSRIKASTIEHKKFEEIVNKFIKKLKRSAKKNAFKCNFFVGGSFGKNTYIKGQFDVDLFCRFDLDYEDSKLSPYLEKILIDAKLKYKVQKGSRDYFSVIFGPKDFKIIFEVIPNRNIKKTSQALNTTDLSPFHVLFLKKKLEKNPHLADEIRLTKQFFKSKKLYGAESYINGFSGHSIDILIAHFGSLNNLIHDAKTWEERKFIDINSSYKNTIEIEKAMGHDKLSSLVIVDPIIKTRNASRALSQEKYSEFLFIANTIGELSLSDFEIEVFDEKKILGDSKEIAVENNLDLILYKFKVKLSGESEDIAGSKMLKLFTKTKKYFTSLDFNIFDDEFFIDFQKGVCLFVFFIEKANLPKLKKVYGPKVFMRDAIYSFLKTRSSFFIEDGKVCIYEKRTIQNISEVYKIPLEDFKKMLIKDISFIKSLRYIKR
ncbi:MAG: nucleotidyltransferase domain-containing protein [Nanoarchaeota archaeon]|nr:nucleotidyltransferase domain-containing protein [Nanoarchaeota archaeon]